MPKSYQTRAFIQALRRLARAGGQSRKAAIEARAAVQQAGTDGDISIVPRTKHGENRLPKVEKYDLVGFHRLVCQLVDGSSKARVFLFVGTHDETDAWLDRNRGSKWVRGKRDNTLKLVRITESSNDIPLPGPNLDVESEDDDKPLLRFLDQDSLVRAGVSRTAIDFAFSVTQIEWQTNPDEILSRLADLGGDEGLFLDVLVHAEDGEYDSARQRIDLAMGKAEEAPLDNMEPLLDATRAESADLVDASDLSTLPEEIEDWAEWMIHLPEELRSIVEKEFRGPARLRGVSGSGKTSVMVHRARRLARRYPDQKITLVTLTTSMRRLLEQMVDQLCGLEASRISVLTVNQVAHSIIESLHPNAFFAARKPTNDTRRICEEKVLLKTKEHIRNEPSQLSSLDLPSLSAFLRDEISYIRGRLMPSDYDSYKDPKKFARRGRGRALRAPARETCLASVASWESLLSNEGVNDFEGCIQLALALITPNICTLQDVYEWSDETIAQLVHRLSETTPLFGRCILVDEVQDLSQLEIDMLGALPISPEDRAASATDGLFLVGDGAQTVYKKGFILRDARIEVANRSFELRRNYRNTREILEAAHLLVQSHKFASVDEEYWTHPTAPQFCPRRGPRPSVTMGEDLDSQLLFLSHTIRELRKQADQAGRPWPTMCVIGFQKRDRRAIHDYLRDSGIQTSDLKENIAIDPGVVKVSTVESAKGHEFEAVFVVNANENVIPNAIAVADEELHREAARLYVAMTRARDRLYLTCNTRTGSRFLTQIQDRCDEYRTEGNKLRQLTPVRGTPTTMFRGSTGRLRIREGGGTLFGRFEVLEELPSGAMAEAYKVKDRAGEFSGDLFLKVVRLTKNQDLAALEREISHYANLQRKNINDVINVLSVERDEWRLGLVTEFASGGTLFDAVPKDGHATERAFEIARSVAEGIKSLHDLGIVHRDLKPENILNVGGRWKIADFGIAKDVSRISSVTFQGYVTLGYSAPEQHRGVPAHPSADVYSFGKILVFLLTGTTDIDKVVDRRGQEVARQCTGFSPNARPNISEVLDILPRP